MSKQRTITFSAPAKVHLLGEHAVVYGKPALLTTVGLRVYTTISTKKNSTDSPLEKTIRKVVEPVVKKHLKIKLLPTYEVTISSQLPLGAGLGSSAAIASSYLAALLTFLKIKWDLNLINELTYKTEKVFHGNPSGADNAAVIYGGLTWYRKETESLKTIHPLPYSIPKKLSKNFVLINTGTPKETTKIMVAAVKNLSLKNPRIFYNFLQKQEQLTKELLTALQEKSEKKLTNTIKMGENNLESIGVVSKKVSSLIREIESSGGVAKICGGGGKIGPTGILLCYHQNPKRLIEIAKSNNLDYFKAALGVEGLRKSD